MSFLMTKKRSNLRQITHLALTLVAIATEYTLSVNLSFASGRVHTPGESTAARCGHFMGQGARSEFPSFDTRAVREILYEAYINQDREAYLPQLAWDVNELRRAVQHLRRPHVNPSEDAFFDALLANLDLLERDPRGIAFSRWRVFAETFVELTGRYLSWDQLHERLSTSLKRVRLGSYRIHSNYFAIPTFRDLSVEDLNTWMGSGLAPLGLTHKKNTRVDGSEYSQYSFFDHDRNHLFRFPLYVQAQSQNYFDAYRKWLKKFGDRKKLQSTLERLWFFVYHEQASSSSIYDVSRLLRALKSGSVALSNIQFRMHRENDLWTLSQPPPSQELFDEAVDLLRAFAREQSSSR